MNFHRLCFSVFAVCLITILPSFECTSGIDPAPATVKTSEGTVVVFGCAYSSNPNIVPVWEINGQRYSSVFPDGHSQNATGLVVLANKLFNGNRYRCHFVVRTNGQYQQISSNMAYLYVNSYEIFNITISKSVVQNTEYSFVCTVSVDCFATICTSNQVTIEWFHNEDTPSSSIFNTSTSGSIPAGNGIVSSSTITTKGNAIVAHAGLFNCRAKLTSDTSYSQSLNTESLRVNMPDSQVVVIGSTVDIGTNATLSCAATPPPSVTNIQYTYQWQVTGGNSISGATSTTYVINSATLTNAGSYTCQVTSKFTGPNKSYVNNPSPQSVVGALTVRINQPLIVQVPHVEADAGSNADLICNATLPLELPPSLFTFTYTWLDKSNNTISGATTSTLTVSGVSLTNGGIYTCNVTARYNGANAQHVNDQKLTSSGSGVLFVKASIKVVMNNITVSFGQSGSFVCNVTLQELANSVEVALLNGSNTLQSDNITATNNIPTTSFTKTFVVDNVNVSRAGEYVCHVQSVQYNNTLIKFLDNLMLISDTARLNVKVAAPSLTMEDVVGTVGSNTILQCRIESVQPMSSVSVQWAKDGAVLTTNQAVKMLDKLFVSNYTIVNTNATDAGDYKCTTISITYQNQYIVSDNSMVTNHVEVHIDPPDIVVQGVPIDLGEDGALQCIVTPKVSATQLILNWTFGSELLVEKTFNSTMGSYNLMYPITSATISNAGLYKCAVVNITYVNSNLSPLPVKSLSLYITVDPPTVTVNNLIKQIGSDVDMTCNIITTQPASSLTVKWRKDSNILDTKTIGASSSTNFTDILNLETVSETDGGDYECEVSNIVYTNTYLTSSGGSKTANLTIKIPVPTVAVDVYGSTKIATSEIVISCIVVINKPTSSFVISWTKDNNALTDGRSLIGRKSSTEFIAFYSINSSSLSDSGVYKCQVGLVMYSNAYLTSDPSSDERNIVVINNPESTVPPVIYLLQLSNAGLKFWWNDTTNAYGYKLNEYHLCQNTLRSHNVAQTCLGVDLLNIERTPPNDFSIYSVQTCNSAQVCSSDGLALQPKNLIAFNFSDQSTLPSSQPTKLDPWDTISPRLVTQCRGLVVLGIYSSTGDYKEVTNYNLPSFLTQTSLGNTPITLSGSRLDDIKVFFDNPNVEWIRIIEKCPIKSCLNDIVFNIGYQGYYHASGPQVAPEPIPSPCTIDRLEITTPILASTTKAVIMTSIPPVIRTSVIPPPPLPSTTQSIIIQGPTNEPASGLSTPMIALIVAVSIFVLMIFIVCLLISVLCLRRR